MAGEVPGTTSGFFGLPSVLSKGARHLGIDVLFSSFPYPPPHLALWNHHKINTTVPGTFTFRLQPPVRGVLVAAAFGRWIGVLAALCRADSPGRRFLLIQEGARRVGTRTAAPERL